MFKARIMQYVIICITLTVVKPIRYIYNILNTIYYMSLRTKSRTIFYDFETTGLNPYHDKIIEYCFIEDNKNNLQSENIINSLVNPEVKFDYFITKLTGIHPDSLETAFTMDVHMPLIIDFLEKCTKNTVNYLIAHNNDGFDKLYLHSNIKKYGINHYNKIGRSNSFTKYKYIDTLLLAKKIEKTKNLPRFSLKELTKHYRLIQGNHRAEQDTLSLQDLYYCLLVDLSPEIGISVNELKKHPELVYDYLYN